MEFKKINEFQSGERIDGFFLIKSVDLKTSSNSKKYLDFTLGDNTGEINAKLWELAEGDESRYEDNMLIKVRGSVSTWMNSLQLKIEKLRETVPSDDVNIDDFVQVAPLEPDFMYAEIFKYIDNMKNKDIKNIASILFKENHDKLMHYPAAKKNHHAVKSGLLYHILSMLRAGEKLSELYTFINKDLLYAGIMLHDMSKLEEMDASELGIVSEYTIEGQLLGHITQGIKRLELVAEKVGADKEIVMLLQHMILSHHYEPEYGSPVKPMFAEAELLHHLDIIDARMYDMKRVADETEKGSFSEKVYSLENRRIYKPTLEQ
ncbi:HD domain-containing protein [Clostridium swellfunianum]|uniref:3'-5' exoribonuclease YhaM family protein n=1 Tax=Clostridium swellfunianum TaxID=1367462 RepID=UPI00202F5FC9|nr:OB-fold nucleic acid binding domain-containing protein [Clostridium swellfunianum]MCM0649725.1 HD domain-containing protein [Clostridium swellfunianum]